MTSEIQLLGTMVLKDVPKYAITDFLRTVKNRGGVVKILSSTDRELRENLFNAISNGSVLKEELQGLIAENEENGNQHIFFYEIPASPVLNRIINIDKAALDLLGKNWQTEYKFPSYNEPGTELEWIDFRKGQESEEVWIGKMHLKESGFRNAGDKKKVPGSDLYHQPLELCEYRVIFVVRMLTDGKLEIRIGREGNTSFKVMNERLEAAWEMLDSLIKIRQVNPWDLVNSRTGQLKKALSDAGRNSLPFNVLGCGLQDSQDTAVKLSANGSIFQTSETQSAMRGFLAKTGVCNSLVIKLKKENSENKLRNDLRVAIGGHSTNEVIIQSKIDAKAFKYVADHLQNFDS